MYAILLDTCKPSLIPVRLPLDPTIDLVHGTVTTFNPTNGETGVGTNAHVRIAFSKRINPLSLQFNNANIYEYNSGRYIPFTTTISTDRLSIALVPNVLLLPNNTYSVYSGGSIRDIAGNSVSASSVIFTTGAGQDTTGPTVSNLTPPNGATGVPVNTHVSALMSAPIDPTTLQQQRNNG